jgi:hypothetical protein
MAFDPSVLREAISAMDTSASSSATGEARPHADDIFAPEHHIGALDPNTTIVLGSRGAGKSFWAGVLANEDTRLVARKIYPSLKLENVRVELGFTGQGGDNSVSRETIDAQVPLGEERIRGALLWRCVMLRAVQMAIDPNRNKPRISAMMQEFADPEDWEDAMTFADSQLSSKGLQVIVLFDALDAMAEDWNRLRDLTDALLSVSWSIRGYRATRAKLFLRPDQIRDIGLRFVELPKMIAGATRIVWRGTDLYGMLFARLALNKNVNQRRAFIELLARAGMSLPPVTSERFRRSTLATNARTQSYVFMFMAGRFMGRSNKKGRTYDWPLNHLADGHGEVTPRSFLTLMIRAAMSTGANNSQVISAESIRIGLREASKARVEQLGTEFKWIGRVLAPLARLQVPCTQDMIMERWAESSTLAAVEKRASAKEFLPPIDPALEGADDDKLIAKLVRMGVLTKRNDGRYDMPDLFRVAARLLRKGGVTPG